jgi:hypothetical protein
MHCRQAGFVIVSECLTKKEEDMKKVMFALAFAAVATAVGAKGPDGGPKGEFKRPDPEQVFKDADADGDGNLSLDEFKASREKRGGHGGPEGKPEGAPKAEHKDGPKGEPKGEFKRPDPEQAFKDADADGDGKLSLDEFTALNDKPRGGHGGHKDKP